MMALFKFKSKKTTQPDIYQMARGPDRDKWFKDAKRYFDQHPEENKISRKRNEWKKDKHRPANSFLRIRDPDDTSKWITIATPPKGKSGRYQNALSYKLGQGQFGKCILGLGIDGRLFVVKIGEVQVKGDQAYLIPSMQTEAAVLKDVGLLKGAMFTRYMAGKQKRDKPYLAMAYGGETLSKKLLTMPPNQKIKMTRELCFEVDALHQKGFVHHDLKPDNVAIDRDNKINLLDYGFSESIGNDEVISPAGTPRHLPYEKTAAGADRKFKSSGHYYKMLGKKGVDTFELKRTIFSPDAKAPEKGYGQYIFDRAEVQQLPPELYKSININNIHENASYEMEQIVVLDNQRQVTYLKSGNKVQISTQAHLYLYTTGSSYYYYTLSSTNAIYLNKDIANFMNTKENERYRDSAAIDEASRRIDGLRYKRTYNMTPLSLLEQFIALEVASINSSNMKDRNDKYEKNVELLKQFSDDKLRQLGSCFRMLDKIESNIPKNSTICGINKYKMELLSNPEKLNDLQRELQLIEEKVDLVNRLKLYQLANSTLEIIDKIDHETISSINTYLDRVDQVERSAIGDDDQKVHDATKSFKQKLEVSLANPSQSKDTISKLLPELKAIEDGCVSAQMKLLNRVLDDLERQKDECIWPSSKRILDQKIKTIREAVQGIDLSDRQNLFENDAFKKALAARRGWTKLIKPETAPLDATRVKSFKLFKDEVGKLKETISDDNPLQPTHSKDLSR